MPRPRFRWPDLATACLVLMLLLIVAGALIWYRPFLTRSTQPISEIPAPSALFVLSEFPVPPHQQACMKSVTVTPDSNLATFQLRPAKPTQVRSLSIRGSCRKGLTVSDVTDRAATTFKRKSSPARSFQRSGARL